MGSVQLGNQLLEEADIATIVWTSFKVREGDAVVAIPHEALLLIHSFSRYDESEAFSGRPFQDAQRGA
jgi:hypothetical protein